MGTILASALIENVRRLTHDADPSAYRNSDAEILAWMSEAQRAVCRIKPVAHTIISTLTLAAGAKQALPAGATAIVSVIRNTSGGAISRTTRRNLDEFIPDWFTATQQATIQHFAYDQAINEDVFYVYPPAVLGTQVDAEYAIPPGDIASATDPIDVDDIYADALQNYVLFRLYSKETEDAAAAGIAASYLKLFAEEVAA